jgi:uncharacterized NAD-dependent epimerase/dehydratase family protein
MKRVVLYPFAKEMHSLVRFPDLLPFEVVGIMDPLGHGAAGQDAGELLGLAPVLRDALEHNLHVFSFDPLDSCEPALEMARQRNLVWSWPGFQADLDTLREAVAHVNAPVPVPVLGIFGTRSGQGKFSFQLAIRQMLERAGYAVGQLGTEPQAPLFGFDAVFPMGFGARVPLDLSSWIPYLRHQMSAIHHHRHPELIIVGSQSGTIPRDPHLGYEFLCLNSQLFLYGTRPDGVFVVVESNEDADEEDYTRETIQAIRILGRTEILGLLFSDHVEEEVRTGRRRRTRRRFLDPDERKAVADRLESRFGLPAASPLHEEGAGRVFQILMEFFGERET